MKLVLAVLLTLLASMASANDVAEKNPARLRSVYAERIWDLFIASTPPPESCRVHTKQLWEMLWGYTHAQQDFFFLNMKDPRYFGGYSDEIRALLKSVEGTTCFQPLAALYGITSFAHFSIEPGSPSISSLYLLFINRYGLLVPITTTFRANARGLWNEKSGADRNVILGAYDCQESKIYFDPYLSPYDVAATLKHELNHLLRDKLMPNVSSFTSKEALLVDETLSSLSGSIQQAVVPVFQATRVVGKNNSFYRGAPVVPAIQKKMEQIKFDLTLYSRKGKLSSIMTDLQIGGGISQADLYARIFQDPVQTKRIEEIVKTVGRVYFPDEHFDNEKIVQIIRTLPSSYFDSITWKPSDIHHTDTFVEPFISPEEALQLWDLRKGLLQPFVLPGLAQLVGSFSKPSVACQKFVSDLNSDELSDYIGRRVTTGVKPGNEGVKPGNEGVKPGASIKPCLRLGEDF